MRGPNIFGSFYETLQSTREYHLKYPSLNVENGPNLNMEIDVVFSGEEVFGKYLDLHDLYLQYCNLPKIHENKMDIEYLSYLDKFNSFFHIPETSKNNKPYVQYINNLWEYVSDFFNRIQPLFDLNENVKEWDELFNTKWSSGEIPGWKLIADNNDDSEALRLGMFNSPAELEVLGMERLKSALKAVGLKCGGTLSDRAQRLWSIRGKKAEDIPAKLKAPVSDNKANGEANGFNLSHGDQRKKVFILII